MSDEEGDRGALARTSPGGLRLLEPATRGRALAVFGAAVRTGEWEPPERLDVAAVFGTVRLDFRHALLAPGVTEIEVTSLFGAVEIVVPPDLEIEVDSSFSLFAQVQETHASSRVRELLRSFLFGSRKHDPEPERDSDEDPPVLYVRARVIFGAVHVRVKP
jgi:hypothetical protein